MKHINVKIGNRLQAVTWAEALTIVKENPQNFELEDEKNYNL